MKTILMIGNDECLYEALRERLRGDGFRVLIASTEAAGIRLAADHQPDVILCDDDAIVTGSLKVLRALQADLKTADIPRLLMTRKVDIDFFFSAKSAGASGFLKKPVNQKMLHHILRMIFPEPASV